MAASDPSAGAGSGARPGAAAEPERKPSTITFPVVGIGGSAGALSALLALFEALPPKPGMAFVVVLHLSPDHESHMAEILGRATSMPVRQVQRPTRLECDCVYVIAPGDNLVTEDGHVQPATIGAAKRRPSAAIDVFFRALAEVHGERAICVVLSGTGSDGALGVTRVKEKGGLAIAQAPGEAEFPHMPRAAIETGAVDLVLPAAAIGERLVDLSRDLPGHDVDSAPAPLTDTAQHENPLAEILSLLRFHTRHDFRHYKRSTVLRRIARRMQINQVADLAQYRDFLAANPKEAAPLLQDLLISVTNFFRDPAAFAALQSHVAPQLLDRRQSGEEIRVWVAGCATGEESYSIAMLLREETERRAQPVDLQIFATDINEGALALARRGVYPPAIATDVSTSRLTQFFQPDGERYRVAASVRDPVLFAKHNLLGDPPLLFLGNSESTDAAAGLFTPVDKANRIFRANPGSGPSPPLALHSPSFVRAAAQYSETVLPRVSTDAATLAHWIALFDVSAPSVLIDDGYEVLHMSPGVAEFVGRNEGVPSDNLLASVAPDLRIGLRTALFRAEQAQAATLARIEREADGQRRSLALTVHPVPGHPDAPRRWLVVFERWRNEPARPEDADAGIAEPAGDGELERLRTENRDLKSQLQDTLDRFAVSAEEYKAGHEELKSINEELRSASEELDTSREELESMNEELGTVNYELRSKVEDATRITDDLTNLMAASDIATVFVDSGLRIKRFTPEALKLFHLTPPTSAGR